jgi:DNA repair exonuclease SbcCD ATPase subunit
MKREFLKELGLEDDVISKIMAEHGKTVNSLKDDADKVDTLEAQLQDLKGEIKDRDKQLEELADKAKGNEELLKEINDLKDLNDKTAKDYQEKLNQQAFDFALERSLADVKAKNPKAVKALLDTEAIKFDGDKLLGLEEQLKTLQESDSYLFGDGEPAGLKGRKPNDNNEPPKTGVTKEQFNQMNYKERVSLFTENPDLYKQLTGGNE